MVRAPSDATGSPDDVRVMLAQGWAAHPDATLAEIERAVDQHLSGYRTAMIEAVAGDAGDARPGCPACGTAVVRVGQRTRQVRTAHDGVLVFTDPAWRCPACGAGLFPPD